MENGRMELMASGYSKIKYRDGYKYQLAEPYKIQISIKPASELSGDFYQLGTSGILTIWKGYCWDGPSGPALDSKDFMRGSLVHDVLYQIIREGKLPHSYRKEADQILDAICKEDGMGWLRRAWVYRALRWFGGTAAYTEKELLVAP